MKKTALFISLILLPCLFISACNKQEPAIAPELLVPVIVSRDTAFAKTIELHERSLINVSVTPEVEMLSFAHSGTIASFEVSLGDYVNEGDVLASLDTAALEATRDRLESEIDYQYSINSIRNEQAWLGLEGRTGVSYDFLLSELYHNSEMRVEAINTLEEQYQDCVEKIETSKIIAPCSGRVIRLNGTRNGYAIEDQDLIYIAREDRAFLYCDYMSDSKLESMYSITAEIEGAVYELEHTPYTETEQLLMQSRGIKNQTRFLVVCDKPGELIGHNAMISFVTQYREAALVVPVKSVQFDSENGAPFVYLDDNGAEKKVMVKTGLRTAAWYEITEGLKEGDEVYVLG